MAASPASQRLAQWRRALARNEGLEDVVLDEVLLSEYAEAWQVPQLHKLNLHIPNFKRVTTSEYDSCAHSPWPAMSITGATCKLMCDHCQAGILKPMADVSSPGHLWQAVEGEVSRGARGMLLSGGSNHRNEVDFAPFYSTIARIKSRYPRFQIAVHTGLATAEQAAALRDAGVDVAMLDIIGAQQTITRVYHLKRSVADFGASLAALVDSGLKVVPHIVMGLHYGEFMGESRALEMIARHPVAALVLVAAMPQYAKTDRPFKSPDVHAIGRFLIQARQQLPNTPIYLGCARPGGLARSHIDSYAVLAGLNGIAHPAEGILALADELGVPHQVHGSCCSISALSELELVYGNGLDSTSLPGIGLKVEGV